MGSPNFGLDMDWVRREAARINAGVGPGAGGNKQLRDFVNYDFRDGQNILRLFPPGKSPGSSFLARLLFQHHKIGPDKENPLCYENSFPGHAPACPICSVVKELGASGVDAWSHGSRGKALTNCLDRFDQSKGPQLIRMPMSVYNWLIQQVALQNIDITNPYNGADVIITRTGKGLNTDYSCSFRIVNGSVACAAGTQEEIEKWMGMLYDTHSFSKNKDWNADEGRQEYAKLQTLAGYLRRQFLGDSTSVQVPAVGGFAPPPPGPPISMPAAPPAPPPPMPAGPANVVTASASLSPVAAPPPSLPQSVPAGPPPPPPPPMAPQAAAPPPVVQAPAPPPSSQAPSAAPPPPPVAAVPQPSPAPPPVAPAPAPAVAAPTVTATSSDAKPPCFGKALNDPIEHGGVKGGYQNGEYRCMMCPQEVQCSAVAMTAFPDLYKK